MKRIYKHGHVTGAIKIQMKAPNLPQVFGTTVKKPLPFVVQTTIATATAF